MAEKQYGFYVNTQICTGCKACMTSCMDRQNLKEEEKFRKVFEFSGGNWTEDAKGAFTHNIFGFYTSVGCQQCDEPVCLKVCPAGVYTKRASDGIVDFDPSKCISCFACKRSCPYGAPTYDYAAEHMKKCIMCTDEKTDDGIPRPACVYACPSRALDFGEISQLREKYGSSNVYVGKFGDITKPNIVIKPHKDSGRGYTVMNPEEV